MEDKRISKEDMLTTLNSIIDNTRNKNLNECELSECVYYLALTVKYILEEQ